MPYCYVMRRAFFTFLKTVIKSASKAVFIAFVLSCLALLSACTLPLPPAKPELRNPPEPPMICYGVCETCCRVKTAPLCIWCHPKNCYGGPSLVWAEVEEGIICNPCDKERAERALNELICSVEEGCIYSAVCLGQIYLEGNKCIPRDLGKAVCWFQRAAEGGITLAMVQMGNFYRDGICVKRNVAQAMAWYEKAACCGDITAMLALGEMYKGWHGTKPNYAKALYWYGKAAEMGSSEGQFQVGWLLAQGAKGCACVNTGVNIIADAIDLGNPEAITAYADLFYEGRNGPQNLALAREYYQLAAERGSAEGAYKLGMLLSRGQGPLVNPQMAAKWFILAGERGYPAAEMYLGDMYSHAWGVPKNYRLAAHWYRRAASNGMVSAMLELADLYHAGKGVPRILEEAVRLYQLAADTCEHPYASLMLSVMYETGRGVPFDLSKSVGYYKRASKEPGFLMAEWKIGRRYAAGFGLPQDWERAIYWYLLAANSGLPIARVELGDLYYAGEGVAKNFSKAFYWYHLAALQGNSYAENMVGLMWLQDNCPLPRGISPFAAQLIRKSNHRKAACWIQKAAFKGARQAQYQLGLLYWDGVGVPQSDSQAYAWIKIALQDVEDKTPEEIVELVREMSPAMKDRAQKLAEQYRLKYQLNAEFSGKVIRQKKNCR